MSLIGTQDVIIAPGLKRWISRGLKLYRQQCRSRGNEICEWGGLPEPLPAAVGQWRGCTPFSHTNTNVPKLSHRRLGHLTNSAQNDSLCDTELCHLLWSCRPLRHWVMPSIVFTLPFDHRETWLAAAATHGAAVKLKRSQVSTRGCELESKETEQVAEVCEQCCFTSGPDFTLSSPMMDVQSCLQPRANERITAAMMLSVTAVALGWSGFAWWYRPIQRGTEEEMKREKKNTVYSFGVGREAGQKGLYPSLESWSNKTENVKQAQNEMSVSCAGAWPQHSWTWM